MKKKIRIVYQYFETPLIHIVTSFIAIYFTYNLDNLLKNWTDPSMIESVNSIAEKVGKHIWAIEITCGIIIMIFLELIIYIVKTYKLVKVAKGSGIFIYNPNSTLARIKANNDYLKEKGEECSHIHYLGATGWNTFGKKGSPLYYALEKCESAEIILLDPNSKDAKERAKNINMDIALYQDEIRSSIARLKSL
jgi:hypothetical protein